MSSKKSPTATTSLVHHTTNATVRTEDVVGTRIEGLGIVKHLSGSATARNQDASTVSTSFQASTVTSISGISKDVDESGSLTKPNPIVQNTGECSSSSLNASVSTLETLRTNTRATEVTVLKGTRRRSSLAMESLTINKLKFSSLGVVGRDREIAELKSCFLRLLSGDGAENELVFIQGYSGIGKSTLARSIKEEVDEASSEGVYVEGKFEFTSTDEPYSGISQAFGRLCDRFVDCSVEKITTISRTIMSTMKDEAEMLTGLIPGLSIFWNANDGITKKAPHSRADALVNDHERWKYAFRTLTKILGLHFSPIVIVLDDIQWADISSLDIMDCLISDSQNPNQLMIIGCYRSNEVDENSVLFSRIQSLEAKKENFSFHITDIKLESVEVCAVNKMIMSMMAIDDESKTRQLAGVCHKRTLGNPFFLIEYMRMLHTEGFLEFNLVLTKWIWNVKAIEDATMSTANVVDLLQARMAKLSKDEQLLLQYAACLGSSFFASNLSFVWKKHARAISSRLNVSLMLDAMKDAMLIEPCGEDEHRWVHDKVQEAALSLSDLVNPSFLYELGFCLFHGLEESELQKQLFDVVDLINKGPATQRPDLAALNLRAAMKARNIAAFQSGARYAACGIKLLPTDMWARHRELTLELYTLSAEMELALGHIHAVEERIHTVLDQQDFTAEETMRLQQIKVANLYSVDLRFDESVRYGIQLLKDVGYEFLWPRRLIQLQLLPLISKTIKKLKALPADHFKNAPLMKDRKQISIMRILSKLHHATYNQGDLPLMFVIICKSIMLTLEHGPNDLSAPKLAALGATWMFLKNDHATCSHICALMYSIQRRFGIRNAAETYATSLGFVQGYMLPLNETLQPALDGYVQGLKDGEIENAMSCLCLRFLYVPYAMGKSLTSIIENFPKVVAQLEESRRAKELWAFQAWWNMMQKLQLPPSEASTQLELSLTKEERKPWHTGNENFAIGELLLFFGFHKERAERLLGDEKGNTYSDNIPGFLPGTIDTFHRGIAWYSMARCKGNKKYQSEANKVRRKIAKWVKAGNPNVVHYDLLLNAEQAVLDKKYVKADEFYRQAIVSAARGGHLHHAALFNERCADYRINVHKDVDNGKHYMLQAIRYYVEWGAIGKAKQLEHEIMKLQ